MTGKLADTNNIRVSQSSKNADVTMIWAPWNYRSTQAAIKEIIAEKRAAEADKTLHSKVGGFLTGDNDGSWFVRDLSEEQKAAIVAAAGEDLALGAEGRKARETELKAAKAEAKEEAKAAKAEARAAAKAARPAEEVAAEKEARAEASRQRSLEADRTRVPVLSGSVAEGDTLTNGDHGDVTVSKLGSEWALDDEDAVQRLAERFPEAGASFKVGDKVQFANFEVPQPELDAPGM